MKLNSELEMYGWMKEGEDSRGIYVFKRVADRLGILDVLIRCLIISEYDDPYCLLSFSVSPMEPRHAEEIAKLFKDKIVWYYLEDQMKVFFWAKSPENIRFKDIQQLEEQVLSSIIDTLGYSRVADAVIVLLEDKLVESGWICIKDGDLLKCRRAFDLRGRIMLSQLSLRLSKKNYCTLALTIEIYPVDKTQAERIFGIISNRFQEQKTLISSYPKLVVKISNSVEIGKVFNYLDTLITKVSRLVGDLKA